MFSPWHFAERVFFDYSEYEFACHTIRFRHLAFLLYQVIYENSDDKYWDIRFLIFRDCWLQTKSVEVKSPTHFSVIKL